ncbi:hypothetical protein DFQ26_003702 [Actinomortierella ambigua]|nr:hypothetical protein DFQ26_003702 [Actinomortierella ambigua]
MQCKLEETSLVLGAFIGAGAYGSVYHARWATRKVAIKKLDVGLHEVQHDDQIQLEIDMLKRLQDRHIIQFYGTTYHEDKLVLVMDYAEGGSLQAAIKKRVLDWTVKIRIAREIVRGLAYIHSEGILHRDLKSGNVLLTRHMEVKLCDFGMATVKVTSSSKSSSHRNSSHGSGNSSSSRSSSNGNTTGGPLRGTFRWMAPELFSAHPKYSSKSDIYALAMVLWEMAADSTVPFRDQPDNFMVMALVKGGEREVLPDHTPADYRLWVERCWAQDPAKRPYASEMVHIVEGDDGDGNEDEQAALQALGNHHLPGIEAATAAAVAAMSAVSITDEVVISPISPALPAYPASVAEKGAVAASTAAIPITANSKAPLLFVENLDQMVSSLLYGVDMAVASQNDTDGGNTIGTINQDKGKSKGAGNPNNHVNNGSSSKSISSSSSSSNGGGGSSLYSSIGSGLTSSITSTTSTNTSLSSDNLLQPIPPQQQQEQASNRSVSSLDMLLTQTMLRDVKAQLAFAAEYEKMENREQQAFFWYHKAAECGHAGAQYWVAQRWFSGHGGAPHQDYSAAATWFHKAADQGHAEAQTELAFLYRNGLGVGLDLAEALAWYHRAAAPEKNHAPAQFCLGFMYQNGMGVAASDPKTTSSSSNSKTSYRQQGLDWYLRAAKQGHIEAMNTLGMMYSSGTGGVTQDDAQSLAWYRRSAELGSAIGQFHLAWLLEHARGAPLDIPQATRWYTAAAAQGHQTAQDRLCGLALEKA